MCVDRAEEMTRGAVSGKMTQLEGLQTVKCDGDTISYDTSLSTFTSGHVSLIMIFHRNHVRWGQGLWEEKLTVHSKGLPKNIAMGLENTADLDDSNVVVGGGQGGPEEEVGGVGRAIVEVEEQEETEKKKE